MALKSNENAQNQALSLLSLHLCTFQWRSMTIQSLGEPCEFSILIDSLDETNCRKKTNKFKMEYNFIV